MSHSKWIACVVVDTQPHMGEALDPENPDQGTVMSSTIPLVQSWLTNQLVYYPDSVMALELMGIPDGAEHGSTNHKLLYTSYMDNGIGMDFISLSQLETVSMIEASTDQCDVDIRGALTVGSELIWERYCINKRLQFGKQIVLFTSIKGGNPAFRSMDWSSYTSTMPDPTRKHIVNVYANGAKAPRTIPSTTNPTKRTLDPILYESELAYISWWTGVYDAYQETGSWDDYDHATGETVPRQDPPPYLAATDADIREWSQTNYDRDLISYILYYSLNMRKYGAEEVSDEVQELLLLEGRQELLLTAMCAQSGGSLHSYTSGKDDLDGPFYREKKTMTKYQGKLHLGTDSLTPIIDIAGFTYTIQAKLPTLSSWNRNPDKGGVADTPEGIESYLEANPDWKPAQKTNREVISRTRTYKDEQGAEIPQEDLLIGWRYGKEDIIPMDQANIARVNYPTSKTVQVLNTVKLDSIDPWMKTDQVDYFQGHKDSPQGQMAINTLARHCTDNRLALMVRYVKRENAQPALGYLTPHFRIVDGVNVGGFFFNRLPWQDDLRPYQHKTIYVSLTDAEVESWRMWYNRYKDDYLGSHKDAFAKVLEEYRIQSSRNNGRSPSKPPTFEQYLDTVWTEQYEAQLRKLQKPVGHVDDADDDNNDVNDDQIVPLIHPQLLEQDCDDVINHKRWAIRNRTPLGFNSAYTSPLTRKVIMESKPFWGLTSDTLTENQQLLAQYAEKLQLPEEFNPTTIRNPGLHRFYGAVKDRLVSHDAKVVDSMRYVEKYLLPPDPTLPQETLDQIAANNNDPTLLSTAKGENMVKVLNELGDIVDKITAVRPVEVQSAFIDSKGRKQWINPTVQAAADAQYHQYAMQNGVGDEPNNNIGLGAPGGIVGVKDELQQQENKQEPPPMIDPRDLGINVDAGWLNNKIVSGVGEEKPASDALKMIQAGKVDEALSGLSQVIKTLFIHGFTNSSKSIDQARNRALQGLTTLREHCVEENRPNYFNSTMVYLMQTARSRDQLSYLKQQQEMVQLYPDSYQHQWPDSMDARCYVIHPKLAEQCQLEKVGGSGVDVDIKPVVSIDPLKVYPIKDEMIESLTPFARFWADVITKQWCEDLFLIDNDECDQSTVAPDQVRTPFQKDPILAQWKEYDQKCVEEFRARQQQMEQQYNQQHQQQQEQNQMNDGDNQLNNNGGFNIDQYEQQHAQQQQQEIVQDEYNWDNYNDDWDPDMDFA